MSRDPDKHNKLKGFVDTAHPLRDEFMRPGAREIGMETPLAEVTGPKKESIAKFAGGPSVIKVAGGVKINGAFVPIKDIPTVIEMLEDVYPRGK